MAETGAGAGLNRRSSRRVVRCLGAGRVLQRKLAAERLAQQQRQPVVAIGGGLEIGDDLLGGYLAPMLEDRGVERADVGEMPVKAAARYPQCFRQRLGLQGRETALSQRLEALIEPILGGKLIAHFSFPRASYHTPPY